MFHFQQRPNEKLELTLRADSQRKAVMRSWRASRTVLGSSFLELLGPLFFSITAFVASLRRITDIAFFDAIFRATSSLLSRSSLSFSFTTSILRFLPADVVSVGEGAEEGFERTVSGPEAGRRLNAGGNGGEELESEAMDTEFCRRANSECRRYLFSYGLRVGWTRPWADWGKRAMRIGGVGLIYYFVLFFLFAFYTATFPHLREILRIGNNVSYRNPEQKVKNPP